VGQRTFGFSHFFGYNPLQSAVSAHVCRCFFAFWRPCPLYFFCHPCRGSRPIAGLVVFFFAPFPGSHTFFIVFSLVSSGSANPARPKHTCLAYLHWLLPVVFPLMPCFFLPFPKVFPVWPSDFSCCFRSDFCFAFARPPLPFSQRRLPRGHNCSPVWHRHAFFFSISFFFQMNLSVSP